MTAFPTPLSAYPPPSPDGLVATLRDRLAQDPFSGAATTVFALAVLHSFAVAQLAEFAKHVQARHDAAAAKRGLPASPSVVAELFHFLGEVEVVFGLWAVVLVAVIVWSLRLADGDALLQRYRQLYRAALRCRDHGHGGDAADHSVRREPSATGREAWARDTGGVVGDDPDRRSAARVVHYRARRDDDLGAVTGAAILRPGAEPSAEVCDAWLAVRECVGGWNVDPFRGAAGADGGARVGMGHTVHARPLRMAISHGGCRVDVHVLVSVPR